MSPHFWTPDEGPAAGLGASHLGNAYRTGALVA